MKSNIRRMGKVAYWKVGALIFAMITLSLAYQNCGKAGFENMEEYGSEVSETTIDPKLANLPFPYDVSVNQIAYMSCPFPVETPEVIENAGYFTWKVGAFDNTAEYPSSTLGIATAGLRLNPVFIDEFKKISAKYQYNSSIVPAKFKEALMNLPSVAGSRLQLSLRDYNHPQTTLAQLPQTGAQEVGLFPPVDFMTGISTDVIANFFEYNSGSAGLYNYFPQAPSLAEASLEASMSIPGRAQDLTFFQAAYTSNYLTVGFSQPQSPNGESIAGPNGNAFQAYAKGFSPSFGIVSRDEKFPPLLGEDPPPVLVNLTERDLGGTRSGEEAWACSDKKFKIVKAADRMKMIYRKNNFRLRGGDCPGIKLTGKYCPTPPEYQESTATLFGRPAADYSNVCPSTRRADGIPLDGAFCLEAYTAACPPEPFDQMNANDKAIYYALRRFLPENIWDINVSQSCIVNKLEAGSGSTCYGDTTTSRPAKVVYDESFFTDANANANLGMYQSCVSGGVCPAYLTLCYR